LVRNAFLQAVGLRNTSSKCCALNCCVQFDETAGRPCAATCCKQLHAILCNSQRVYVICYAILLCAGRMHSASCGLQSGVLLCTWGCYGFVLFIMCGVTCWNVCLAVCSAPIWWSLCCAVHCILLRCMAAGRARK
jgi:hypothetical protein